MPTLTSVAEVIVTGAISTAEGRSTTVEQIYHYCFNVPFGPTLPTLINVADAVTSGPAAVMIGLLQEDYTWQGTRARWLDDVTVPYVDGSVTLGSGTITTARLPSDVTVRLELETQTRGKSFKGGKSYRPIAESQVTGDELSSSGYTAWLAMKAALESGIVVTGQNASHCVVSRILSQLRTNPTTIIGAAVYQAALNKTLGTMKGRHRRSVR